MTWEIGVLLGLLVLMAVLFISEKLSVDLTALLGLLVLMMVGLVPPEQAFDGFASPAVITMLSVFFVSGALRQTGVADAVGAGVYRLIGSREVPLIAAVMVVAAALSAFMNNVAACAVLMPAVASICRKSQVAASRLFMPLAFAAILGGTITLVGTPPNLLAAEVLSARGYESFTLFDFAPLGLIMTAVGILFMVTAGRLLLPNSDPLARLSGRRLARLYDLDEKLFSIRIPNASQLNGLTLREAHLGRALGVQVVGIVRNGKKNLTPGGDTRLQGGDILMVRGAPGKVEEIFSMSGVEIGTVKLGDLANVSAEVRGLRAVIPSHSPLTGNTIRQLGFRQRYASVVVGLRRRGDWVEDAQGVELQEGDELFLLGLGRQLEELAGQLKLSRPKIGRPVFAEILEEMGEYVFMLRVPSGSQLPGRTVRESRVGELSGLTVAGIVRSGETILPVSPDERIRSQDELLVTGNPRRIRTLTELGSSEIGRDVSQAGIESEEVGIVEAVVAPRSQASGRSLSDLHFRDRTGLHVLAIWREGETLYQRLSRLPLKFGDGLLLQGPWERIRLLAEGDDFILLTPLSWQERRTGRAPFALLALALMIVLVAVGLQPVHVAAFLAAIVCAASGAITMQEAYKTIEWKAIFLMAAILPMGAAMEETGAAALISGSVTSLAGPHGPTAVSAGLFTLSSLLSQSLDGAPTVVLLAPVILQTSSQLGISPQTLMMGATLGASVLFLTPFSGKASLLVMGPGGYRVKDFLRVGFPLTIILLVLLVFLVPVFYPY
ncbi:MAG TPA: SLC13 family permease [Acidobacteriota bacterium]|nr:SLC13 family permease [Acidobacteriota bacterium]